MTTDEIARLSAGLARERDEVPDQWSIVGARVRGASWVAQVDHERLLLDDVELAEIEWAGASLLQSTLRGVIFAECTLRQVRFSEVVFEHCTFGASTFEQCDFVKCEFLYCTFHFVTLQRIALIDSRFANSTLVAADLRDSEIRRDHFIDCNIQGLRMTRGTALALTISGGSVRSSDFTGCNIDMFRLCDAEAKGLRMYDCTIGSATYENDPLVRLEISGGETGTLVFSACANVTGLRLLETRIGDAIFRACKGVQSPFVSGSTIRRLLIGESTILDAAFERVSVAEGAAIEGGTLAGLYFDRVQWMQFNIRGTSLTRYVTVTSSHFRGLRLNSLRIADDLQIRRESDTYGVGSATWGDLHGA